MLFGVPAVFSRFGPQADNFAHFFTDRIDQLAAVILSHNPKSVDAIKSRYSSPIVSVALPNAAVAAPKVRVLLVPGHEPDYGGAEYGDLKEREMTVELAADLKGFLDSNNHFQTFLTRNNQGWYSAFTDYFKTEWNDIIAWQKASAQDMAHRITAREATKPVTLVYHNDVPKDVALRLYGINKWADENDIDITIHIHFNDDPTRPWNAPGSHSGFAIYIPEHQYANSTTSKAIAGTIFKRLAKYNPVSNLDGESSGVVEDPDLIAIGAHDTSDGATMLIEYGYIYESQFAKADTRSLALKDLAYQTYLGLEDFFDDHSASALAESYDSLTLPHQWKDPITAKNTQNGDVFALQTALLLDGEYPPLNKDLTDCPRTGKFGPCTIQAVSSFQKKYNISNESDIVGAKTLQALNQTYGI
jgi:N-acetylmuramoyl-L-alanine amidase